MAKLSQIFTTNPQTPINTSSKFGEYTTHSVSKCKNKRCQVCNIIIKRKFSASENPQNNIHNKLRSKFQFKKIIFYIIKYTSCNEIYIG